MFLYFVKIGCKILHNLKLSSKLRIMDIGGSTLSYKWFLHLILNAYNIQYIYDII